MLSREVLEKKYQNADVLDGDILDEVKVASRRLWVGQDRLKVCPGLTFLQVQSTWLGSHFVTRLLRELYLLNKIICCKQIARLGLLN